MNKQKARGLASSIVVSAALLATVMGIPSPVEARSGVVPGAFEPGKSYFGTNGYIEYLPGNLPVVFAAPHAGSLEPSSIPVRTSEVCGSGDFATANDYNTESLARQIQVAFFERTGMYPHVIINRLNRNRLDANRPIGVAACGNAEAERAWTEFHEFIDAAEAQIEESYGKGWFTDIHGHGHAVQRLELGYNLNAATLRLSDDQLNDDPSHESSTSFKVFSEESPLSFADLLRGPTALGTLFEKAGYPATPSQQDPAPAEGQPFFSGGHNTRLHGCQNGGQICGVQIEHNRSLREPELIPDYAKALYDVYNEYLLTNFNILVQSPAQSLDTVATFVVDLVQQGELSRWHGQALTATLTTAKRQLERDGRSAEKTIDAFVRHVKTLDRSGDISTTRAERLTTLARGVVRTMHAAKVN